MRLISASMDTRLLWYSNACFLHTSPCERGVEAEQPAAPAVAQSRMKVDSRDWRDCDPHKFVDSSVRGGLLSSLF